MYQVWSPTTTSGLVTEQGLFYSTTRGGNKEQSIKDREQ